MLTQTELDAEFNPLSRAFALQQTIEELSSKLYGLQIEYNQIMLYCKEKKIEKHEGYSVFTRRKEIRKVDPKKFSELFPEENKLLVQKRAAFMGTELDKLIQSKLLPMILIQEAEELVGKIPLNNACTISVTEKITIVKEKEE